jgi:hypothetical protein
MSWEVIGVIGGLCIGAVGLVLTGIGIRYQILSYNMERKLLKRENPPSRLGKTDSHVG